MLYIFTMSYKFESALALLLAIGSSPLWASSTPCASNFEVAESTTSLNAIMEEAIVYLEKYRNLPAPFAYRLRQRLLHSILEPQELLNYGLRADIRERLEVGAFRKPHEITRENLEAQIREGFEQLIHSLESRGLPVTQVNFLRERNKSGAITTVDISQFNVPIAAILRLELLVRQLRTAD